MLLAALAVFTLPVIDIPPMDVKRALQILDPAATRQVSRQLEREVVMVRSDDREAVFAKLADVLDAEWVRQNDGILLLSRSGGRQKELEAADTAALETEIAKELAVPARILESAKSTYDRAKLALADLDRVNDERSSGRAGSIASANGGVYEPVIRTPLRILREEFLLGLGAAAIARLPLDQPVVWSTTPTLAQRSLPAKAKGIVESFIETQAHLTSLAAGRMLPKGEEGWYERSATDPGVGSADFGDVLFMVFRSDAYIWTLVAAFDSNGKLRGREAGYVFQRRVGRLAPLSSLGKPRTIEASPVARLLFTDDPTKPLESELQPLFKPEELEPLAISTNEAIRAVAEDRQIVARLPDDLCEAARRASKVGRIDLDLFQREAARLGSGLQARAGG